MNIREIVSGLAGLEVAQQTKVIEAANSMRETNALLSTLGAGGRRGRKPRAAKTKVAPPAPAKKGRTGKAASSSVLTD